MEVAKVAYKARPRGEDVNAESRTQSATIAAPVAPIAPQVQSPVGGAPKVTMTAQPWYSPVPIKAQPWEANPVQAPTQVSVVTKPKWTLKDVAASEPAFVNEFKNLLWDKFQNASEKERGSIFWQGVKQNPELASASFVRRALQNMADANNWINGEKPPTLTQAMQNTLANNDTQKWLKWVKEGGKMPKIGG
jgi:hypothetical protein